MTRKWSICATQILESWSSAVASLPVKKALGARLTAQTRFADVSSIERENEMLVVLGGIFLASLAIWTLLTNPIFFLSVVKQWLGLMAIGALLAYLLVR